MPTYQYVCTACGERLEAVQSFSDDALTECPSCAGALRKVFSSVGVVFKGSGFYKTDSRDSAKPAAAKADGGKDGTSTKTDGGSSDGNGSAGSAGSSSPATPSTAAPAASSSTPSSTSSSGSSSTGSSAKSTPAA